MEFSSYNFLQTTTQIEVGSNTDTASNLFNPDVIQQYVSDGYNSDTSTATIKVSFSETLAVSRIGLREFNGKKFNLYYNELTANAFDLTSTGATTTSQFTGNTESSMYLKATQVNCTSVSLDIYSTIQANSEKALGFLYISDVVLDFPRIPSAANYKPKKVTKKIVHSLSDGGTRIQKIRDKWNVQIKFKHIEKSFVDDLEDIYDSRDPVYFVPFPTTTAWDSIMFEASWLNDFEFYTWTDNAANAGFSGSMKLAETPD